MLTTHDLSLRFGEVVALEDVGLTVDDGETVAVLGPSGSGKSTLLRVVAGLQAPDAGRVCWDGNDVTAVPPHERGFGLMFQDFALFPHRDVAANVAFGLRMQGVDDPVRRHRVDEVLDMVGLAGYGPRAVGTLSGGEAQRVALARALAPRPRLLMLDEPLGSLDRALRARLVVEIGELLDRLGITALYVTHDQEEAFAVADRVVVMRAGAVVQEGPPEELYAHPADEFVARFLGFANIVDATVGGGRAETPWGLLPVPPGTPNGPARLVVRPDALRVALGGPITATVESATFRGDHVALRLRPDAGPPIEALADRRHPPGEQLHLAVDVDGVTVLARRA